MTLKVNYDEAKPDVEKLVSNNMALVRKIAWHMHGRVRNAVEIDDLLQVGYFGLVTAAQKYSKKEGASFASYAVIRIKGSIVDYLRKSSNLCRTTIQMQQKTKLAEAQLRSSLHRDPTKIEIAEKLGLTIEEFQDWDVAFSANVHQSLDSVYDEYSIWFASKNNNPEEALNDSQLKATLKGALSELPKREAMVIQLYYVEELNVYEIADVLEITTGRVSQIKKSAVALLRNSLSEMNI